MGQNASVTIAAEHQLPEVELSFDHNNLITEGSNPVICTRNELRPSINYSKKIIQQQAACPREKNLRVFPLGNLQGVLFLRY